MVLFLLSNLHVLEYDRRADRRMDSFVGMRDCISERSRGNKNPQENSHTILHHTSPYSLDGSYESGWSPSWHFHSSFRDAIHPFPVVPVRRRVLTMERRDRRRGRLTGRQHRRHYLQVLEQRRWRKHRLHQISAAAGSMEGNISEPRYLISQKKRTGLGLRVQILQVRLGCFLKRFSINVKKNARKNEDDLAERLKFGTSTTAM